MESKINDEFIRTIVTEKAWKELSGEFKWNETLLEKYQDQVDWKEISSNDNIRWTIPMIRKFLEKIDWTIFSAEAENRVFTPEVIEAFKYKWDWHVLSGNPDVPFSYEFLEKYADLLDWDVFIDSYLNSNFYIDKGIDLYNQFKEYIPADKIQNSNLWYEMVKQQRNMLHKDIFS